MADDKSHRAFQRDRTFAKHDRRPWSSLFESSIETKKQTKFNNGHSIEDETIRNLTTSSINISETSSIIEQTSTMISAESMASNLNANESKPLKPWRKLTPLSISSKNKSTSTPLLLQDSQEAPTTPEPALLDVKQKLVLFEKLNSDVWITITPRKYVETATRTKESNLRRFISKWELGHQTKKSSSNFYASTDELRSEEKKQADYQENELTKAVRVELPVIVPLQGSSVAINNLRNLSDSDEKDTAGAGEGKENVITLNSIDIPNLEEDTSSNEEADDQPDINLVSEDDDTSSNEGEFEFFKEPINDTPITPTLKQPLIYDNHLTKLEIPLNTEVIQVPADITSASEDEELSSNEGDYDFTAEPNKEKPFIQTLVYNKHLNILETPLVPEAVHVSDVEENNKEDKSGYVPSVDEDQSEDELNDKFKGKTKQDERRSNMTLSFEQPKSPLENLNKSFLSPAFKKFLGLDVETDQEDEKSQGNKEELKPEVSSSSPTITNHQYRIDKNYAHKLSPKPRNKTPDILETKYLTPKFDHAKSHKSLILDQESSTVIADLPEIVPKPRIKRKKSNEKTKSENSVLIKNKTEDYVSIYNRTTSKEKKRGQLKDENTAAIKPRRQKSKEKQRIDLNEPKAKDLTRQKSKDNSMVELQDDNIAIVTAKTKDFSRQKSLEVFNDVALTEIHSVDEVLLKQRTKDLTSQVSTDIPQTVQQLESVEILEPETKDISTQSRKQCTPNFNEIPMAEAHQDDNVLLKPRTKDFSRNYRSLYTNQNVASRTVRLRGEKYTSLRPAVSDDYDVDHHEMHVKGYESIQPILDELIKTEETYVDNLWTGLNNYGKLFEQKDLPRGLKGKKYVLFCNVEQIAEFHLHEFLPMLHRNRHDLKRLFDDFQQFIEEDCFYAYVLYAMNNQRSLELCNNFKKYFMILQVERQDNLGINSFLLQPIQRVARYPLMLKEFIKKLFDNYPMKPIIDSCCRLDKKLQNLLKAINKSEVINDIECISETHEFNIFYQGKFRDVGEFSVHDHTLKRSYRSRVFVYDKCIIYTEIKRKQIIFRGRYPREHLGMSIQPKYFTLYYNRRKQQECDFMGDPQLIKQWTELIRDIITAYAEEEKARLKLLHCGENVDVVRRRQPANLLLFRDTNRFSTDSGISNV